MDKTFSLTNLAIGMVIVSLLLTGLGGLNDMLDEGRFTKSHMWNDGVYLAIIAIFVLLMAKL